MGTRARPLGDTPWIFWFVSLTQSPESKERYKHLGMHCDSVLSESWFRSPETLIIREIFVQGSWLIRQGSSSNRGVVLGGVQVGPFDSHDYSWMMITLWWHFGKVQVKWISFLYFICWDELCKRWFFNTALTRDLGLHDPIGRTYVAQPPSSLGCFERFFLALLALHKDARDVVDYRNYLSISYHFPWRCEWPRNIGRAC